MPLAWRAWLSIALMIASVRVCCAEVDVELVMAVPIQPNASGFNASSFAKSLASFDPAQPNASLSNGSVVSPGNRRVPVRLVAADVILCVNGTDCYVEGQVPTTTPEPTPPPSELPASDILTTVALVSALCAAALAALVVFFVARRRRNPPTQQETALAPVIKVRIDWPGARILRRTCAAFGCA